MNASITLRKISKYTARGVSPRYVKNDGLLVLNQKCIRDQKINTEPARLTDKAKNFGSEKRLQKFDILINSTGVGTLGRVAQLKYDLDATVDSHITIFRPAAVAHGLNEKINPLYVGYCVRNQEKFIESKGAGATGQTELSKDSILDDVQIYLPKYSTQTLTASILSAYDDLIENNEKRIKALEEIAQLLYTEWFVKFKFPEHEKAKMVDSKTEYGYIPDGWQIGNLRNVATIVSGYAFKSSDFQETGTPVIKIKNIGSDRSVSIQDCDRVDERILTNNLSKYILNRGDIIIAMTGATAGKVGRIFNNERMLLNQRVAKVKPNNGYYSFIWGRIGTEDAENELYRLAGGAAQPNMSSGQIENIPVLEPSKNVILEYEKLALPLLSQILTLQGRGQNLSKIRDLLIPQLVTGKRELK